MAEMSDRNSKNAKIGRRRHMQAAREILSNREELSQGRRHIYEGGIYAPEDTPKGHRGPLSHAEIVKIGVLYQQGVSQLDISIQMGISTSTVRNTIKRERFVSPNKAKGGWKNRKGTDGANAGGSSGHEGRARLLAEHDAGLCDRDCRLGRHGRQPLERG